MWCLSALLLRSNTNSIWIWTIGCFCNIFVTISDLSKFCGRYQARPIFRVLFLLTGLAANVMLAAGCVFDLPDISALGRVVFFIIGLILLFIQALFSALNAALGHVVFLIHMATPAVGSEERPAGHEYQIPLLDKKNDNDGSGNGTDSSYVDMEAVGTRTNTILVV